MQNILSQKDKPMLLHEGYSYRLHRVLVDGETRMYRCHIKYCKGRIRVNGAENIVTTQHDCGAPQPARVAALTLVHVVNRRAVDTQETPRQIILASQHNLSAEEAAAGPSYNALQQRIERKRKLHGHPYPEPATAADLVIPQPLTITEGGDDFLLYDSGAADARRFIMFATQANIELIRGERNWFVDGIFKVTTNIFYQVRLTITAYKHCQLFNIIFKLFEILISKRMF